jgi:DNA-binding transcriptional ArsR family regulator
MKHEARVFRSLADETRLSMLCLLMQHDELCVCDFTEVLEITQSKASRHLRYLYNVGWVSDRREGSKMKYRLCVPPAPWEKSSCRCCRPSWPRTRKPRLLKGSFPAGWRPNPMPQAGKKKASHGPVLNIFFIRI